MKSEIFTGEKNAELVTTDKFMEFIYAFNKPIICPICDGKIWDAQGCMEIDAVDGEKSHTVIESLNYARYRTEIDVVEAYPGGLPVFRLTCNNCAYFMLFSYKRIRALIKSRSEVKFNMDDNEDGKS